MDLSKVLEQLRQELEYLDRAILSLERIEQRRQQLNFPGNLPAESRKSRRRGKSRTTLVRNATDKPD